MRFLIKWTTRVLAAVGGYTIWYFFNEWRTGFED